MKRLWFVLLPTLLLASLVAVGFWAGTYVSAKRIAHIADAYESAETLAGVLKATPLSDRQRSEIFKAYSNPNIDPKRVSWAVPNQPTPFVGTAPKPGAHQNATINSWQMRSDKELGVPKAPGAFRIFLTGGSTAYGSGAPSQDKTIGALLEAALNQTGAAHPPRKFEVFTFANPAWSSTQERIAIENYLSDLEPDLIVSLSGNNDVFWGDAGRNILWYSTFSDDYVNALADQALAVAGRKPPTALVHAAAATGKVPAEVVATRLVKNATLGATALHLGALKVNWLYFLQPNLAATKKALSPREAEFLTPSRDYYRDAYAKIAQGLGQVPAKNFLFVNLSGLFDGRRQEEEIFLDQFHFGDIGNAVIAKAMAQEVVRRLR
ncbi:hypothetical protein FVQ98_04340 [Ottowia sp. GY511]|uniref:SGNH/GDSL hydrolase family protein n=1 Tax=Ottowia flava TaxID=2675430 RepID=A0ABW4KWJ0_9BURK|nr:hypothetical protein [Ottowia sp. GY511]TXK31215.1 hypothetical protein FVQ98_04340 [Ottowia sp. GY511]